MLLRLCSKRAIIEYGIFFQLLYDLNGRSVLMSKNQEELLLRIAQLEAIFEQAPVGIALFDDKNGRAYQVNERFVEIVGRTKKEVMMMDWREYSHPEDVDENNHRLALMMVHRRTGFSMEKRFLKKGGEVVWVNMTVKPFQSAESDVSTHLCLLEDITAKKKAEKEILYLSYYDQLTGVYNRRYYEEELRRIDSGRNLPITLVLADLDGLKLTNDAFGHMLGDSMLKKIGQIFKSECRNEDMIARIGGDEFVFFLPRTTSEEAEVIITRINARIAKKQKESVFCSVSFGWDTKSDSKEDIKKVFMRAESKMYRRKLDESNTKHNETVKLITKTLYQKNRAVKLHCERVGRICELIGNAMMLGEASVKELKLAGQLHDIGKIGIDESLLTKIGALTDTDWKDMKRHPEIGYHILRSVNEFAPIAKYVLHHHERVDGRGYPGTLKTGEIPIQSRILSVADAFDAMTTHKPYREDLTMTRVIEELTENAGSQFDQDVVKVFLKQILREKIWRENIMQQ